MQNKLCSCINLVWYFEKCNCIRKNQKAYAPHHVLNVLPGRGSSLDGDGVFALNLPASQQLKIRWLYCTLSFFSASPH